ncbi:FCD domain-containing protein [Agrobacterium vitis]|uniref:GntR family transcriptional regulator n=1 Tax=Agrobacterium vitis TaxID=373 RepID=A0AAE2RCD6_AGRVI|nr:GntR family transcriptional regulator [Agrobacterium vitis]MBF2714090.1 GntR family transcriptional regulator [Agrobacterium vitis]MUO82409.1 FCD domain-containing protein [Agrobacterium vitis]MUO95884.1 FCD domain-containing protein [Agrobacterium vitis]MVA93963.1 FCD domain-containing protein [Agrobacterium vitis]MVB03530.1 FCD domain-containing protein [Agrobacterium vitis]
MQTKIDRGAVNGTVLDETVRALRSAILEGRFRPGDRLVEAELCQLLSISRPSLREALRRLEAERLVDIIPNRGPIVPVLPWSKAQEIYQARNLLEAEAAALAARNALPSDLEEMRGALAAFRHAVEQGNAAGQISHTREFYDSILRSAGNSVIAEIIDGLHARISFLRGMSMSQPGRARASLEEMSAIADAISEGDEQRARKTAAAHVINASRAAAEVYARSGRASYGVKHLATD